MARLRVSVLKVLSENLGEPVVFGIRPKMRVEPAQLVCCAPADGKTQHRFVWMDHSELLKKLLRFTQSVRLVQDNVPANASRNGGNKLDYCLMRDTH